MAVKFIDRANIVPNKNLSLGIANSTDIRHRLNTLGTILQPEPLLQCAIASSHLGKNFWDIAPTLIRMYHQSINPYPCDLRKKRAAIECVAQFSENFPENSRLILTRLDQIWKAIYVPVLIADAAVLNMHVKVFSHSSKHPNPRPLVDLANGAREKGQSFWNAVPCLIQKWYDMERANPEFEKVAVNIGVYLITGFAHKTSASAIMPFIQEVWEKIYAETS